MFHENSRETLKRESNRNSGYEFHVSLYSAGFNAFLRRLGKLKFEIVYLIASQDTMLTQ